jgi:hypothetical protein
MPPLPPPPPPPRAGHTARLRQRARRERAALERTRTAVALGTLRRLRNGVARRIQTAWRSHRLLTAVTGAAVREERDWERAAEAAMVARVGATFPGAVACRLAERYAATVIQARWRGAMARGLVRKLQRYRTLLRVRDLVTSLGVAVVTAAQENAGGAVEEVRVAWSVALGCSCHRSCALPRYVQVRAHVLTVQAASHMAALTGTAPGSRMPSRMGARPATAAPPVGTAAGSSLRQPVGATGPLQRAASDLRDGGDASTSGWLSSAARVSQHGPIGGTLSQPTTLLGSGQAEEVRHLEPCSPHSHGHTLSSSPLLLLPSASVWPWRRPCACGRSSARPYAHCSPLPQARVGTSIQRPHGPRHARGRWRRLCGAAGGRHHRPPCAQPQRRPLLPLPWQGRGGCGSCKRRTTCSWRRLGRSWPRGMAAAE